MAASREAESDTGNQRVTNALLKQDISHVAEMVRDLRDEQRKCNDDHEGRIRALEGNQRHILALIEQLDQRVKGWGVTNSLGIVVAGILAAFGIRN